ncbi:AzlD domain-containing protein [Kineosporia babensis]|uniref:AzlD domain-containing protein n=1 Tax=Kineosporia babensis TaxID=499548 RepID=A0A9X1NAT5_9ACTN|nr:AzlD domain-containing protein [Kineosporia babensis]MCD5309618.1 AzlD domain-containing protein [Kineosporia babensis]
MPIAAIFALAAGTFAFRRAGPLLADHYQFSESAQAWMTSAATTLLAALIATSTLVQDGAFAGWARFAGVGLAVVLVLAKAPFPLVVIAAAGTTAVLRQFGVA